MFPDSGAGEHPERTDEMNDFPTSPRTTNVWGWGGYVWGWGGFTER